MNPAEAPSPTAPLDVHRGCTAWGTWQPTYNLDNTVNCSGIFQSNQTVQDSSSVAGVDALGVYFSQTTSAVVGNDAFVLNDGHIPVTALPRLLTRWSIDAATLVNGGVVLSEGGIFGYRHASELDAIAFSFIGIQFHSSAGDTNLMLAHTDGGGPPTTRTSTGVAIAQATYPDAIEIEIEATVAGTWLVTLRDVATGAQLYQGTVSTDCPTTGDFVTPAVGIEAQGAARTQYIRPLYFDTAPAGRL